jgi:putative IMPACT (imprinted ancient) family translation regulator
MPFLTLSGPGYAEMRVRGSSFLAFAAPAASDEEARGVLAERQRLHFDATHNCSAWRLRGGVLRANDAGEPSGSAGPPILATIEGAGVTDCVVVVTRYFGGTKLGVGGLVRAYGDAAAQALAVAPRRTGVEAVRLRVIYPYGHTAAVMRVLEAVETYHVEHGYAEGGLQGEVTFCVPSQAEPEVARLLRDATAGEVVPSPLGAQVVYRAGDFSRGVPSARGG